MKAIMQASYITAISILLAACGGSSTSSTPASSDAGDNTNSVTLSGKVLAPDNSTPLSGATVYIPSREASANTTAQAVTRALTNTVARSTSNTTQNSCSAPNEEHIAYACSKADGSFSLALNTEASSLPIAIKKGIFSYTTTANLSGDNEVPVGNLTMPADSELTNAKIAVVSGLYDRMQDILAKLGLGEVDSTTHQLVLDTEKFDLYDGTGNLPNRYPVIAELFEVVPGKDKATIYNYDIVFINCIDSYIIDPNPEIFTTLRDYVAQGGRLYVTDLAYHYVEQAFPEYINFYGSEETAETEPETQSEAEVGREDIVVDATIHNTDLASWLANVSCEEGDCLNPDGSIRIESFLGGWAVIEGAEPSKTNDITTWISGNVTWFDADTGDDKSGNRQLTMTFDHGQGRVLYTSYHTAEDADTVAGFLPQERVLQYLIFEM